MPLLAIGFCMHVVVAIDRHSHSVSHALYGAFPFVACTFLIHDRIATRAGRD